MIKRARRAVIELLGLLGTPWGTLALAARTLRDLGADPRSAG